MAALCDEVVTAPAGVPSMSATLQMWLIKQPGPTARGHGNTHKNQALKIRENSDYWWGLVDQGVQAALAGHVVVGYALEYLRAQSEDDFESGILRRDIPHSVAYREIDIYRIFNVLPDLALLDKGAVLGGARIRELIPEIGCDGIGTLVKTGAAEGITYERACGMSTRDIIAWRKEQRRHRIRLRMAQDRAAGLLGPDMGPAHASAEKEPQEVITAREEALAITWRMRAELALLQQAFVPLAPAPGTELSSAHFGAACLMARGLSDVMSEATALHAAITQRFGEAVTRADGVVGTDAKAQALRTVWIREVEDAAAERIRERHQRHGWRGRPATRRPLVKTGKGKRGRPRKAR